MRRQNREKHLKKGIGMVKLDWRTMIASLGEMTEEQVKAHLDAEVSQHKRPVFLRRLHQRYSSLRTMRERGELMLEISK